jgi:hypothetical protein
MTPKINATTPTASPSDHQNNPRRLRSFSHSALIIRQLIPSPRVEM